LVATPRLERRNPPDRNGFRSWIKKNTKTDGQDNQQGGERRFALRGEAPRVSGEVRNTMIPAKVAHRGPVFGSASILSVKKSP